MRSWVMPILTLAIIVLNPRISVAQKVYSPHVEKGEVEPETQTDVAAFQYSVSSRVLVIG
jgi:hypothetical protein